MHTNLKVIMGFPASKMARIIHSNAGNMPTGKGEGYTKGCLFLCSITHIGKSLQLNSNSILSILVASLGKAELIQLLIFAKLGHP